MICATCIMTKILYNELFLINQKGKVVVTMKAYMGVGLKVRSLLPLTPDRGKWSASYPS